MAKNNFKYGPENPHPLSTRKTELIWEGKYDEYGNRREVDIAGCAMPMQKIETIDEPASRLKPLGLFDSEKAHKDDFRNMSRQNENVWFSRCNLNQLFPLILPFAKQLIIRFPPRVIS